MYEYISASVDSRLSFVCHCFVRNFQIESIIIACHAIIFTIGRKASHGMARFITAVETRVHNTSREETIDCKSFLFLCNVDAKIDGKLLRKGRTLISSTRYSFPFEKVVSINMTRYSATFSNNEFSFSRFFFFFFPRVIYSTQLKCYILFYDIITEILIFEWRRKIWSTNSRIHYLFLYYLLYNTMWSSRRENYWLIIRVRSKENIFFNWNILRGYAGNLLMIIRILITTIIIACDRN